MEHKECCQGDFPKFKIITRVFDTRRSLFFFLLKILLNIKNYGEKLCYCERLKDWLICKFKRIHLDYEYSLYENMFSLDFLAKCHSNLYNYFRQLFETENHSVCFLLSNEFQYQWKDWFTGKKYKIPLTAAIK